jgi:protein-S-isoprenylcysteine O-methyltransferase Ste14
MYAGAVVVLIGMPLALASWWGLLFLPLFVGLMAWRLLHEEAFLGRNLPGYPAYMQTVRYRLVPYVW